MSAEKAAPGALIALDGTLNFRDLGGWPAESGEYRVLRGRVFRSDRLSDLTAADHRRLVGLGIATVVDLRYEAEVEAHPSRLWPTVVDHHEIPLGGDLADQRSFIERALAGEYDGITDADVGESYLDMLRLHAEDFGRAVAALLEGGPALFHCTAGKDRTGLLSMLLLRTVGVGAAHVLADFALSNEYRAERRMAQLRPTFEAHDLDIESFRPALSAPPPALERAMAWIDETHGGAQGYLTEAANLANAGDRLRAHLLEPAP
ncbi:MAG: tyrosine-protein phosphatase [Acidimicrobiia bacterium]|nr:tyrosine-protein phosphatase [Acidimicrobiia bacterium]